MWISKIKIILGSGSPRRKELLEGLGFEIKQDVRPITEVIPEHIQPKDAAIYLAELKAGAFKANELDDHEVLLTSDTTVVLDDKVLGKPKDSDEAFTMIQELSGKAHQVITGVCIKTNQKTELLSVSTDVWYKKLAAEEIKYYIEKYKPFDKAGAYGIQEWIGKIGIAKINGCFYNVMGLPTSEVYSTIRQLIDNK
jgi:septum formation protein